MRSRWLLVALLVGLVVRVDFEAALAPYPRQERIRNVLDDQSFFLDWAASLANGKPLDLIRSPHEWAYWAAQQPRVPPQAPLYPAILAFLARTVGGAPSWIRAFQVLAGLATIALVFVVARRRFGEPTAALAAFGAALYAPWIFFEATVLRTSWLVLAFVGIVAALDALASIERFAARRERLAALGTGALLALAVLLQEQFLLLGGVSAIWLARRRRGGARWLLLGGATVLLPFVVWASLRAGRPVLSTASARYNLLIANLHDAGGQQPSTTPTYDAIRTADERAPVDLIQALATDVATHPAAFARLLANKAVFLLRPVEIPNNVNYYLGRRENPILLWMPFDYPTLLPLAIVGLVLARRSGLSSAPLLVLAALYALSLVAFVPLARLRQPLALLAIVFAAAGAIEVWRRVGAGLPSHARSRTALALSSVTLLLALGLWIRPAPLAQIRPSDWQMAGAAWENEGASQTTRNRLLDARAAYVESLVRNPAAARTRARLDELDARLGTPAIAPLPHAVEALCAEGAAAAQHGDLAKAERLFERATREAPRHPRPWHLLSNVLFLQKRLDRATAALENAVTANPHDPLLAANLAALRGLEP